jgi:hypothetical protein
MRTHLRDELDVPQRIGALDENELEQARVACARTRRASSRGEPTRV